MEITTLIGYIAAMLAIVFGIVYNDGTVDFALIVNFLNGPSVFIVIVGTFAALLASIPFKDFKKIGKHIKMVFFTDKKDPHEYVEIITELSREARKKGLLALEDKANSFSDPFLRESILMIIDAIEPDKLKVWFDQKLSYIETRNAEERRIYDLGAAMAPAFGMLGTVIGLVNMLKSMNFEDGADALGQNMSVALITTFYGSILANCVFIPMSSKVESAQNREMLLMELIIEGVISIKEGENPKFIHEKLQNFLEGKSRRGTEGERGENA